MSERIVVDPITRIEGHLRIEAQMEGDVIANAYSSGTMVRGIEIILQGRDPRDASTRTDPKVDYQSAMQAGARDFAVTRQDLLCQGGA